MTLFKQKPQTKGLRIQIARDKRRDELLRQLEEIDNPSIVKRIFKMYRNILFRPLHSILGIVIIVVKLIHGSSR